MQMLLLTKTQQSLIAQAKASDEDPFIKKVPPLKRPRRKHPRQQSPMATPIESKLAATPSTLLPANTFEIDVRHRVYRILKRKSQHGRFRIRMSLSGWNLELAKHVFQGFANVQENGAEDFVNGRSPVKLGNSKRLVSNRAAAERGEGIFLFVLSCHLGAPGDQLSAWCSFEQFDSERGWGPCLTTSDTTTAICLELSVIVRIDGSLQPQNRVQVTLLCTSAVSVRLRQFRLPPSSNKFPYYSDHILPLAVSAVQRLWRRRGIPMLQSDTPTTSSSESQSSDSESDDEGSIEFWIPETVWKQV